MVFTGLKIRWSFKDNSQIFVSFSVKTSIVTLDQKVLSER